MMKKITSILFGLFLLFLFLEIVIGFPISLEHEPLLMPKKIIPKTAEELKQEEENRLAEELNPKPKISQVDMAQKMKGVHLVESRNGTRDWELFAEQAQSQDKKSQWVLKTVKVFFYNLDKIDFIVTGDSAFIEPGSKNIRIEGNVTTKSANGYQFKTPSVAYLAKNRSIQSLDKVEMLSPADEDGPGFKLEGQHLEAFVDTNKMIIHKKVKGTKSIARGREFRVSSGSSVFSGKDRSAIFKNNVTMQMDSIKMEGPEAHFVYKEGAHLLESLKVVGGAKVTDADKFATSDSVIYDPEKNDFIFMGKPRVVQNSDEIIGEKIIFVDGGKRVKVEKIKANMEKPREKE